MEGGGDLPVYRCDTTDRCLNPTLGRVSVPAGRGFRTRVAELLRDLVDAVRTDTAPPAEALGLVNLTTLPVCRPPVRGRRRSARRAVHAPEPAPAGDLAFEDPLERLRLDRAGQPERQRALARPGARLPVGRVIARVVAILLEIAHALRRRGDLADRRYQRGHTPADGSFGGYGMSMPHTYGHLGQGTRREHSVAHACRRMAAIVVVAGSPSPAHKSGASVARIAEMLYTESR